MFRRLKRDAKISLRAIELRMEVQPLRKNSKFDPDSAEIDLGGEVSGEGEDRRGSGVLGDRKFLSTKSIIRLCKTRYLRFRINGKQDCPLTVESSFRGLQELLTHGVARE